MNLRGLKMKTIQSCSLSSPLSLCIRSVSPWQHMSQSPFNLSICFCSLLLIKSLFIMYIEFVFGSWFILVINQIRSNANLQCSTVLKTHWQPQHSTWFIPGLSHLILENFSQIIISSLYHLVKSSRWETTRYFHDLQSKIPIWLYWPCA